MIDALQTLFDDTRNRLVRAAADGKSAWRLPVFISAGLDGTPEGRTVVLRGFRRSAVEVDIYTDHRTPKVAEVRATPAVSLVFWDKRASLQLRAKGTARLLLEGEDVEAAKARLGDYQGSDYARWAVPGSPIEMGDGAMDLDDDPLLYFAIVRVRLNALDWLELARDGHRRARFDRTGDGESDWTGTWTVP